jgi:TnpA family transposase
MPLMLPRSERLTVLSEADQFALYGLPDFDESQRFEYFAFTEQELNLILNRKRLHNQIFCALQLGYFKAKQTFFRFSWNLVANEDIIFISQHYFSTQQVNRLQITKHEYYAQRSAIIGLFNYRLWSKKFTDVLQQQATQVAQRDITPHFIALELISFLQKEKVIRPGYTTLQAIISYVLAKERERLGGLIDGMLDEEAKNKLDALLVREGTLSELAALKQDAKNFKFRMMALEREKKETLKPIYLLAKTLLPQLAISKQNIVYYASLANYYTIYDLRRLSVKQTYLYLLCYAWQRYQQLNDNLIDAIGYHLTQAKNATKEEAKRMFAQASQGQKSALIGRLLLVYVDEDVDDSTPFGEIRKQVFSIMPKETIGNTGKQLCNQKKTQLFYRWQAIDKFVYRFKKHLRPLFMSLDFSVSTSKDNPWLTALTWFKQTFSSQQNLQHQPLSQCPDGTIPKRLKAYLLKTDGANNMILNADRYEYWVYQQLHKHFRNGAIYLQNSTRHCNFNDELISIEKTAATLKQLRIPWGEKPIKQQLDELFIMLHELWVSFNTELKKGALKHLHYDTEKNLLTWRKPRVNKEEELMQSVYSKLPFKDIIDVLRFVNKECHFLPALTPLQPRYSKQDSEEEDCLLAVIISQAMNHGNVNMAEMGDITYSILETTYHQRLRLATLNKANDIISTAISKLPIFPYYSLDLMDLYSSVDGQKYNVHHPTTKARYSKKYFKKGKGVVAYTLLMNHIPLQSSVIGAHDPESYFVFDIYYNNATNITPTVITGDMHALNKANFAIMYCFGTKLEIRLTNLQAQLKHLYSGESYDENKHWLIKPVGEIDRQLIEGEKKNLDRIIATLGLKEITQSDLVKKLCTHTENQTFKAFFELDKLLRSIYTLRYLQDYQLQRRVHSSQNRIESYHQLRAAIARVGGDKELAGRTDVAIEVSNQCGRLIANAIVYYNSVILSRLLEKYLAEDNQKAIARLRKVSPVAWQHIYFQGHYTFCSNENPIDLDAIVANLILDESEISAVRD